MKRTVTTIAALTVAGAGIAMGVWLLWPQPTPTSPVTGQTGSDTSGQSTQQPAAGEVTIRIKDSKFVPESIVIRKGTKVNWVNDDAMQHNVVADETFTGGLPTQNSLLGKGGSYSFTFDAIGTFDYHCTPHPFMTGKVVVAP